MPSMCVCDFVRESSRRMLKVVPNWSKRLVMIVVELLSCVRLFATPWTGTCQTSLPFTIFWSWLKLISFELVMPSNDFIFCHLLLLLASILPNIRVFSNELALCIMCQSTGVAASASVLPVPSDEYLGLVPLALTGFICLLSKGLAKVFSSTVIQKHQFFGTGPLYSLNITSILWMNTEKKIIALTIWTFIIKVMSLLFNMLSTFVIAFLPKSKCPFISWL